MHASKKLAAPIILSLVLTGCGGGTSDPTSPTTNSSAPPASSAPASSAPTPPATTSGTVSVSAQLSTISGGSATYSGTASVTPAAGSTATVTSYQWNWGDGTVDTTTAATDSHTYSQNTTYTLTVTASLTSGSGPTGTQTLQVQVPAVAQSSQVGGSTFQGYGEAMFTTPTGNPIVSIVTDFTVPAAANATANAFTVWPGLEPAQNSSTYQPVGLGVLQAVVDGANVNGTVDWATADQYNNLSKPASVTNANPGLEEIVNGVETGIYSGYQTANGAQLLLNPGDVIHETITLGSDGQTWTITAVDKNTNSTTSFSISLLGQEQNIAYLLIETAGASGQPNVPLYFNNTVITWQGSAPANTCWPTGLGPTDTMTAPQLSTSGTSCSISQTILRGVNVPATAM